MDRTTIKSAGEFEFKGSWHTQQDQKANTMDLLFRAVFEKSWRILARGGNGSWALTLPPRPRVSVIRCRTTNWMIVLVFAGMCCPTAAVAQTTEYAIHIDLDSDGRIQVDAVDFPPADDLKSRPGLLIWTENGLDRWQVFPAAIAPQSPPQQPRLVAQLSSVSRGDTVAAPEVISLMTVQLDQLIGAEVLRGVGAGGIFTPANDMMHLNGSITVRRLPAENGEEYPESELVLRPEGGEPIRVSFPKGRSKLKWTEIQDLPTSWQDGLPPGEYSLSYADGGDLKFPRNSKRLELVTLETTRRGLHL